MAIVIMYKKTEDGVKTCKAMSNQVENMKKGGYSKFHPDKIKKESDSAAEKLAAEKLADEKAAKEKASKEKKTSLK